MLNRYYLSVYEQKKGQHKPLIFTMSDHIGPSHPIPPRVSTTPGPSEAEGTPDMDLTPEPLDEMPDLATRFVPPPPSSVLHPANQVPR